MVTEVGEFGINPDLQRVEKYTHRGFAVAVPGLMAERLSKQLLESSYLHVDKTDILLRVEPSQRATTAKLSHPRLASPEGIKVQCVRDNSLQVHRILRRK